MASSPNYNWSEPDNSSLVKDGAQAIRTLGDAIDTSVWNVGFGQAGKNKIINGDFFVNQRNTTSTTTSGTALVDRFRIFLAAAAGSVTGSVEQFTPGNAPVAGYDAKQYLRVVSVGQAASTDRAMINYAGIEDVRTFAGQTITFSFWAKAASGTPNVSVEMTQVFGSGGSPSSNVIVIQKKAISTSWVRYSYTFNVGSIVGKTIGTDPNSQLGFNIWFSAGSSFDARTDTLGLQNNTFEIWGVQAEYGSTATPFQTASGGSIQGELAMCQRYFNRFTSGPITLGNYFSTTRVLAPIALPVQMRIAPTGITSNSAAFTIYVAGSGRASSAVVFNTATPKVLEIDITSAADTAGRVGSVTLDSGSFDVSAEL